MKSSGSKIPTAAETGSPMTPRISTYNLLFLFFYPVRRLRIVPRQCRKYFLEDIADACRHVETQQKTGIVVIDME